jgi:hypothetical protein
MICRNCQKAGKIGSGTSHAGFFTIELQQLGISANRGIPGQGREMKNRQLKPLRH